MDAIKNRLAEVYAGCGTEASSFADIDAMVAELAGLTNRQLDELGAVVDCGGMKAYAKTKADKLGTIKRSMQSRLESRQRTNYGRWASPYLPRIAT